MKTIILPGYSLKNREWAEEVRDNLELGHEIRVHEWRHWKNGSFSMSGETERIIEQIGQDKVNIIAKSVGTSVAVNLIQKIPDKIVKVIICGIPFRNLRDFKKNLFVESIPILLNKNIIVFQNEKDLFGSYASVKKFIHSINKNIKVVKKPRSDHHYPYTEDFKKFLL